jgi:flagellar biosynthesis protein
MDKTDQRNKKAVALTYGEGQYAPQVVAKGTGVTAEAIIALAARRGVYVHESPVLVELLMQIDLDRHIPPELYVAVAELLAWLYRLENRDEHLRKPGKSQAEGVKFEG